MKVLVVSIIIFVAIVLSPVFWGGTAPVSPAYANGDAWANRDRCYAGCPCTGPIAPDGCLNCKARCDRQFEKDVFKGTDSDSDSSFGN